MHEYLILGASSATDDVGRLEVEVLAVKFDDWVELVFSYDVTTMAQFMDRDDTTSESCSRLAIMFGGLEDV